MRRPWPALGRSATGKEKKYYKNMHHTNITGGSLRLCSESMWISLDEEATETLRE